MKSEIEKVVSGDYCTGCGLCSYASGSKVSMEETPHGTLQPNLNLLRTLDEETLEKLDHICPFSSMGEHESEIASRLFPNPLYQSLQSGHYKAAYAGYCISGSYRSNGSSGGMTSWFLCELLKRGTVEQVIHVRESAQPGVLFDFTISGTPEELKAGAKSRYYAVSYANVLEKFREVPRSTAIVGVPCFIKALRRLAQMDAVVEEYIKVHVALVCGHLKSHRYAEMMGWQKGIRPGELSKIDFRLKMPGVDAHTYGVKMEDVSGKSFSEYAYRLFGTNWGEGMFKLHGCDFCDDVLGETADVVFGDAWIDKYDKDWNGANIAIIRNPLYHELFIDGKNNGEIHLEEIDTATLVKSQAGSFRHRHDGLVWRIRAKEKKCEWVPKKRFASRAASLSEVPEERMNLTRMEIARQSHLSYAEARKHGRFELFQQAMQSLKERYHWQLAVRDLFNGNPKSIAERTKQFVKAKFPWIVPLVRTLRQNF